MTSSERPTGIRVKDLDFDHAVIPADPRAVVGHLLEIHSQLLNERLIYNHLARRLQPVPLRTTYVSALSRGSTVVWTALNHTRILEELSSRLCSTIPRIFVSEPTTARAFLKFHCGELAVELLDPEPQLRTNTWSGDDLIGCGKRQFQSLEDFLSAIKPDFVPVDWLWTFGRWENLKWRETLMKSPHTAIRWALQVSARSEISVVGDIPAEVQRWVAEMSRK